MAASSSLLDLAGWTREDFNNRWTKVLPCLISDIEQSNETATDIFQVIFVSIVPVAPVSELEEIIFSQICEKMAHHFGIVLDSVVQTAESLIEMQTLPTGTAAQELNVILEGLTNSIVSIATCLNYLSSLKTSVALANIRSLPYCVLDLMVRSFGHCKDSGQLYGQLFGHVSDHLSGLFKATRLLQTNFSVMLEKLDISYPTEQDKEDLCYIIQKLCSICDTASRLDVKIMVALWKTVSRLSCQYRDFLLTQLDVRELLTSLCDNMSSSSSYFCQQDSTVSQVEESSLGKMIKILGFQMRVLVTLTKEYNGYLGDGICAIYQLIVQIKSFLPPSLVAQRLSAETREELARHVGIGLEPLVCGLIDDKDFISLVLKVHQENSSSPSYGIARLMLLLTVAQLLPSQPDEVQTLWLVNVICVKDKPRQSLIHAIFSCMFLCYKELFLPVHLPGVVKTGTPAQGEVSLYEHVVTRLCAFVVTFPGKHFSVLENCLLENVLERRQHCAMAAIDVWCFLARCGSADLCRDHCSFLLSLLTDSRRTVSAECCHLVLLIRRLFRLMAPEHQTELVSDVTSLEILSILPLDVSSPVVSRTTTDQATDHFGRAVVHWTSSGVKTFGDAQTLLLSLLTLRNVCQSSVVVDDVFDAEQRSRLVAQCLVLLSLLPPGGKTSRHQPLLCAILSSTLYFVSHLGPNLNNRSALQVLHFCDSLVSPDCKAIIKLSVLEVLGAFATKIFGPDTDQCQILRLIPRLFSRLLSDTDAIVQQVALEVFENFAQKTSHESLVPDSLSGNEHIREKFISYVKLRATGFQSGNVDVEGMRMQGEVVGKWCLVAAEDLWLQESNAPAEYSDSRKDEEVRPPVFKRPRIAEESVPSEKLQEEQEEEKKEPSCLRQTLDQLGSTVSTLEAVSQTHPLPDWAVGQLSEIQRRLAVLV